MQAATIVPQAYLHLIENHDYHLALAHLINKEGFERYTEFYNSQAEQGRFVILDNGLIEGDPRPIDELYDKAMWMGVSEMVLPDVFKDGEKTLFAVQEALGWLGKYTMERPRIGAVAQGTTLSEVIECAQELLTFGIDTLYIPKVVTSFAGAHGRLFVLEQIQEQITNANVEVHLLGCWNTPMELRVIENYVRAKKIKPVRGVDSAIAYVHARAGITLLEDERPDSNPIDFLNGNIGKFDELLAFNIRTWQEECQALPPMGEVDNVLHIKR